MLEQQRRELTGVLKTLRHLDKFGVSRSDRNLSLDELDKRLVEDALREAKVNQAEAARLLKITRDRLRYKATKYQLGQK